MARPSRVATASNVSSGPASVSLPEGSKRRRWRPLAVVRAEGAAGLPVSSGIGTAVKASLRESAGQAAGRGMGLLDSRHEADGATAEDFADCQVGRHGGEGGGIGPGGAAGRQPVELPSAEFSGNGLDLRLEQPVRGGAAEVDVMNGCAVPDVAHPASDGGHGRGTAAGRDEQKRAGGGAR